MIDFEYDDCPTVCGNGEPLLPQINSFCETCPVREAENNFKEFSCRRLESNPDTKGKWQKWGFDNLKRAVEEIASMEDALPVSERTIKTHRLIQCFQGARLRFERIERENEKKAE